MPNDRSENVRNWTKMLGCALAFLSAVLYGIQGSMFQLVYELTSVFWLEALLFMEISNFFLALAIVALRGDVVFREKDDMKWLVALSALSAVNWPLRYCAMVLIPLADVFALSLSGGMVLQLVLGGLLLKERCGILETVICLIVLGGMALLIDPRKIAESKFNETETCIPHGLLNETSNADFRELHSRKEMEEWNFIIERRTLGILLSIADCLLNTVVNMILRKVAHVHIGVVLLYIVTLTIFGTCGLIFRFGQFSLPRTGSDSTYVTLCVLVSLFYNSSTYAAYLYEESGTVSTIRTVELAFSYLFQFLVLGVVPSLLVAGGATIGSQHCDFHIRLVCLLSELAK